MENTYQASTVEMDHSQFGDLKQQILSSQEKKSPETEKSASNDVRKSEVHREKKNAFKKGDQSIELDDDFEIEFMADKMPTKLTLRELKNRAAGDIAIKNRMHSLAEEKKRVQSTFREFASLAKTDPLGALEFISNKAKESDNDFEYSNYIEKLAEQAEKLGKMDEKERKAWDLEKKLQKAEKDLSHKEQITAIRERKAEILSSYPEIGDQQFGQMVEAVLNNEELVKDLENEDEVLDAVEDLIVETLTQKDIISVIRDINPAFLNDNDLIFHLSDQLRSNPDLDEEDVRDILREVIQPAQEKVLARKPIQDERKRDMQSMSNKTRQGSPVSQKKQNASPYDLLKQQLIEHQEEIRKTPLYKR